MDLQLIRPSRRGDLEVICRTAGSATGDGEWIVKDPIQLNYFFLDQIQHWLFERMDGSFSLKETQQAFSDAFAGAKISEQQLLNFCMRLSRDGLLSESLSGEKLSQRQRQQKKLVLHKLPLSLMSVRLPGFNAGSVITLADSLFGWIFSPLCVLSAFVWLLIAFCFGIQFFDDIVWALPSLANVGYSDIVMLMVCVSVVKIVHELAHAVCCRRMGAKCSEIGLMFLVFSPCLYCNVTDSWMLPNKWKRIAIAAAGIYVELLIASASLFLWYYAETAFLKSLFLNLMIVCSVSTLLVNGNPLMRYDGYFILSDLVGVPNLSHQARNRTWDWIANPFFVTRQSIGSQCKTASSVFLIAYHIASLAYRVFILTVIFLVCYALLEPVGLQNVASMAAIVYVVCLVTGFFLAFIPMLKNRNPNGRRNWAGILIASFLACGIAYFVSSIKVPHSINTSASIEFNEIAICSAKASGTLQWTRDEGEVVREGEVIARLIESDSELEKTRLANELQLARLRIENLKSRSGADPDSRIKLPSAESELVALTDELAMFELRQKDLELVAPMSGMVVEALKQPKPDSNSMKLATWHGSALQKSNRGCSIEQGETICLIGKRDDWKVFLLINEQKRDLISGGEKVTLRTSLERNKSYRGIVGKIFTDAIEEESSGQRQFRTELLLEEPVAIGFHGAVGKAKVTIDEQTLWATGKRFLQESFRFEF